ncbi:MAG TPA: glycosyltransferase family 4 protein [Candidatus Eisenbacteria bacterium]|nr:glycosyltransferase family 4 protein [Candidatus Eisenbacteria bacterium]
MPIIRDTLPPMRVVFLTSRLPFPPEGGDRFRVFHQIRTASEAGHEVHLVTFACGRPDPMSIAPLERLLASITVVPLPPLLSAFRAAKAIAGCAPFQAAYYRSRRMEEQVRLMLRRVQPDVVVTHLFRMAPYALANGHTCDARWILDLTDVISAGIARSLPFRKGLDRWLYREERRRIQRYESEISPRFDECWVISHAERNELMRIAPSADVRVVPNGLVPNSCLDGNAPDPARLLFLGFHQVFHNRDAVRFLVQDILPRVRESVPEATLDVVGAGGEALGPWARGPGVHVLGHVPRLEPYFARATVFVAPHRFAAGVQNKVVHALANGVPVVATSIVRQGLEPIPKGLILTGESAHEIAARVVDVIRNPARAAFMAERGREWARATFNWRATLEALEAGDIDSATHAAEPLVSTAV